MDDPLSYAGAVVAGFVGVALWLAWATGRLFGQPAARRRTGEPADPPRRPVAEVAADLARLAAQARRIRPGEPMARRRAVQAAYDDVLREAADLLGIPACWDSATGTAHDAGRLVTEAGVAAAGLPVRG